ncbi:glycoside hydrolase [Streptomyces sp. WAC 01529]|uniref:glycoside hydrolase family 43 protein n=1 Tax=Streptomyces sp. WAC 01529 TaxID=2203205 RepID=UPI000F6F114D|nr:glycoside hydrolase 43 family protein [Streptomyces sp. WAC 01529]AZM56616.1 glycoside hydrolase [Streptomyces sp. WAC 01529]
MSAPEPCAGDLRGGGLRAAAPGPSDTTGDLGDGTYRNPVLAADWSDPDVVRVGDDFYLTASSFGRVPGLPLLHSRDLVNWTLIGHALDRLEPAEAFASPRHDCGVWAPSLRHHDARYWIFWGDPDHGVYQVNARHIRGPWTRPHLLKAGKGLIDPCPLWDEETGLAYLVHAWAKSRSGVKNLITGYRMSPDGRELLDEGSVLIDGDRVPGWFTIEGPKIYRHDGWFWILAPAGGVATGWQGAFRSRAFHGPYEERVVLQQGGTGVNGPHQGGWVRTATGEDWFLHFQQRGAYGRVVHLQPMRWDADGWPVLGNAGTPVDVHRKPDLPPQPPSAPATGDDFPGGRHGPQWQWTANPRTGWATSHSADGLRLTCVRTARADDVRALPHTLTQRLPLRPCSVEVELRLDAEVPGTRAGLAVLGDAYSWVGLERDQGGAARLVHRFAEAGTEAERDAAPPRPAPNGSALLRVEVTEGARCRFHADTGEGYRPTGAPEFTATPWRWVGALLALFAAAPAGEEPTGTALFTHFRITHRTPPTPREESRR